MLKNTDACSCRANTAVKEESHCKIEINISEWNLHPKSSDQASLPQATSQLVNTELDSSISCWSNSEISSDSIIDAR